MADQKHKRPPANTRWIMSRRDLPNDRGFARYELRKLDGTVRLVTLGNRKRQVVDALLSSPIFSASPVRLSDMVLLLRHEHNIDIRTEFFTGKEGGEQARFGVYMLRDNLRYLGEASSASKRGVAHSVARQSGVAA